MLNAGEAGQGFMNLAAAASRPAKGRRSESLGAVLGPVRFDLGLGLAPMWPRPGAITLPAMTRLGYPRALAGAVEAVASSGGQIMPPLMGAGAFVMVELTGGPIPASWPPRCCPAILYFWAVWIGIDAFAAPPRPEEPAPEDQRPPARDVAITSAFFRGAVRRAAVGHVRRRYTPQYAACLAILAGGARTAAWQTRDGQRGW